MPSPSWWSFRPSSPFQVWVDVRGRRGERSTLGSSKDCRKGRAAMARVTASNGLPTEAIYCSGINTSLHEPLQIPGGRCVECLCGGNADWRCCLNSASKGPYLIGRSVWGLDFLIVSIKVAGTSLSPRLAHQKSQICVVVGERKRVVLSEPELCVRGGFNPEAAQEKLGCGMGGAHHIRKKTAGRSWSGLEGWKRKVLRCGRYEMSGACIHSTCNIIVGPL